MRLGALEAGGTKMVLAVGDETGKIYERISIPTRTPDETMPEMISYFKEKEIEALGIGCFGPIDPNPDSPTYGYITSTPKLDWQNFNIVGAFVEALNIPVGFDTDVNASALGEATYGITKGLDCSLYLTVGTGIGAGVYMELKGAAGVAVDADGKSIVAPTSVHRGILLHGMLHPEAGHIMMRRHPADEYEGKCPFHKDCFEGLASGPAIEERWGQSAKELADRPEVWEVEAYYIAQALVNYSMVLSPRRIVLGGGVMHQEQLFPLVRKYFAHMMAGYVRTAELNDLDSYIVPCSLNDNQGIMGCFQLAVRALG